MGIRFYNREIPRCKRHGSDFKIQGIPSDSVDNSFRQSGFSRLYNRDA